MTNITIHAIFYTGAGAAINATRIWRIAFPAHYETDWRKIP